MSFVHFLQMLLCQTKEEFDVSGPIRSIGMCSYVQCVMQESQCVVEIHPVWPLWSRDLTLPPRAPAPLPYLPGHWRTSLLRTLNKDGSEQWSGHLQAAQPRTCGHWRVYVNIVLSIFLIL